MRTYNVSKRREQEHDHPLQLYIRIQGAGRLRGENGSQERQRSLLALPTEGGSHLEMESPVYRRGGNGLPREAQNDPAQARVAAPEQTFYDNRIIYHPSR